VAATEKAKRKRCGDAHLVLSLGALHGKVAVQEGGEVREVTKRNPLDGDTLGQHGIIAPKDERRCEHKKEGIKTKGRGPHLFLKCSLISLATCFIVQA